MNALQLRGTSAGAFCSRPVALQRPVLAPVSAPRRAVLARSSRERESESFLTGFVLGGVIFGTLGFLFAPQVLLALVILVPMLVAFMSVLMKISKSLLGDDQNLKLPKFMEEEKDPEQTKQELIDKIAQLNKSIDDVASSLKPKEAVAEEAAAN